MSVAELPRSISLAAGTRPPFLLLVHTLTIIWYTRYGHDPADVDERRAAQPWYRTKTEPAFEDTLIKLRRTLPRGRPGVPEPRPELDWAQLRRQALTFARTAGTAPAARPGTS